MTEKIDSVERLEELYGEPVDRALWKEVDHLVPHYQEFIAASPFLILATQGEHGLDSSPRGDPAGFVRIVNEKQILIPDRKGNNRVDSLRNIIYSPAVSLIFLIPGVGETLRVSGQAEILLDSELCSSFAIDGKPASSVISISVNKVYFQCQKAIARSGLWDSKTYATRRPVPTIGEMMQYFSGLRNIDFDGEGYDKNYPERLKKTMY